MQIHCAISYLPWLETKNLVYACCEVCMKVHILTACNFSKNINFCEENSVCMFLCTHICIWLQDWHSVRTARERARPLLPKPSRPPRPHLNMFFHVASHQVRYSDAQNSDPLSPRKVVARD